MFSSFPSAFTILIRSRYAFAFWLVIFISALITSKSTVNLASPMVFFGIEIISLMLMIFSVLPVIRLLLFKLIASAVKSQIQPRYAILFWIFMTICTGTVNIYGLTCMTLWGRLSLFISLYFMVLTITYRIIFKRVTPYVDLNRMKMTLHMTANIRTFDLSVLHDQLSIIVEEFVTSLSDLPQGKTYTFKTHQAILDELLKHRHFQYQLIGKGVVYEKTSLLALKAIFNKRLRRRFLLKKENKYKVTV